MWLCPFLLCLRVVMSDLLMGGLIDWWMDCLVDGLIDGLIFDRATDWRMD